VAAKRTRRTLLARLGSPDCRERRPLTSPKQTSTGGGRFLESARRLIDHVAARCPHSRGNRAVRNSWSGRAGGSAGGCRKPESSRWFSCGREHGTRSVARVAPLLLLPPGWGVYFPRLGCSGQDEPSAHEVHPAAKTPSIPPAGRWRKRPKPQFTRLQRCRVATWVIRRRAVPLTAHGRQKIGLALEGAGAAGNRVAGAPPAPAAILAARGMPSLRSPRIEAVENEARSDRRFNGVEED
jgi:hypothetical protein